MNKLNRKKVIYVANVAEETGVAKKVHGFCKAAKHMGYDVEEVIKYQRGIKHLKRLMKRAIESDGKYVIVRSFNRDNIFCLFDFFRIKLQGKVLIIDQPTPAATYIKEIAFQNRSSFKKIMKRLLVYLGCPLSFMIANRVVQYAEEAAYFRLLCRKKTILVGNGIDTERLFLRAKEYPDGKNHLSLVGVASSISAWHGFDRIIRAMDEWKKSGQLPKITFDIVGDGDTPYCIELKKMVELFNLCDEVKFLGYLNAEELNKLYSRESLAVASLGLYRNGLLTASVLKAREYCLAGIPFIASGNDPDFPNELPFRFVASNDEKIDNILEMFSSFAVRRKTFSDKEIRQYAIDHLSFEKKFEEIMDAL